MSRHEAVSARQQVERLLQRAVQAGLVPGGVAAWRMAAGLTTVAVGRSRVVPRTDPASPGTLYDLASLTKPLLTVPLFLLARRQGLVDLETRVGEVLDEIAGSPAAGLRLLELLTHTSGLPAWAPLYACSDPGRWLSELAGLEPGAEPGTQVVYSCPGFLLAGAVLERVYGEVLAHAFIRHVAGPLGLTSDLWAWDGTEIEWGRVAGAAGSPDAERQALAELGRGGDVSPPPGSYPDDGNARFLRGSAGNAGLFGTAEAVIRLADQFIPHRSRLLTAEEIELATRNWTPGMAQARGLGWQLAATPGCSAGPAAPPGAFGHTGFTGTSLWITPRGTVAVLLTNRHHPAHRGVDLHPLRRRFHTLVLNGE